MNSIYRIVNFVLIVNTIYSIFLKKNVEGNKWLAVRPNSSEYIHTLPFPNSIFKYKFRGNDTNGLFTLFEAEYLDDGPGKHIHTREDELFHIIDGHVQFFVDGKQFCGSTGDYVYVPRHVSQAIRIQNIDKRAKPVRIQILLAPSGLEGFLDEIEPLYYNGQDNLTLQNDIADKYGIINLEPVDWQDLGCFPATTSSSTRLTPFFHLLFLL
ncbi:unnamed protein product [Rotaria sordida]|uniref:Cupin type-2 domain-containing protein n=1 Tax=Rotaria sordida TaxID=392033 RepID=A0A819KJ52_9BILA|nr:unnamed protein product [Rotaria sordida]CAF3949969.1 unnamed protein product [Rotaria sordida]CAF4053986.1 unnamed protein product [Rotaria sordida]